MKALNVFSQTPQIKWHYDVNAPAFGQVAMDDIDKVRSSHVSLGGTSGIQGINYSNDLSFKILSNPFSNEIRMNFHTAMKENIEIEMIGMDGRIIR